MSGDVAGGLVVAAGSCWLHAPPSTAASHSLMVSPARDAAERALAAAEKALAKLELAAPKAAQARAPVCACLLLMCVRMRHGVVLHTTKRQPTVHVCVWRACRWLLPSGRRRQTCRHAWQSSR